ncbi:MAG: NAD(P)(+) transhydrogenase (Re/Si-specific) subunit alpha [Rickettsiales bacterium]|nr:NAD(P)(+) transhydrogenase (Re/Si-specific) subunit alpha [Rickettsiales bacterium]|tara:strand:- start:66 stop:1199 length:1134 start_codon:yes stop_codon:yes gene_type:complete
MKITIFKEDKNEQRISIVPETVKKYIDLGIDIQIEPGIGHDIYTDSDFVKFGAKVIKSKTKLFDTDIIIQVNCPKEAILKNIKKQTTLICLLDPFFNKPQLKNIIENKITSLGLEFIPRSTYAQKMDVLSSQSSLAGYVAVMLAASKTSKIFPMMMTPAGTISPSKVFIVGAGVAGLQAIATAKRLGAQVEAFDTRPVVEEQVKSLGAKFLKVDLGQTGESNQGYAKELTANQLEKQKQVMLKACKQADIVITTAQLFGKKAPIIITNEMIAEMKQGSIIVDLAIETGGNVEASELGKEIDSEGVHIIGLPNLASFVAKDASLVFSSNIFSLIEDIYDKETKTCKIDLSNDIIKSVLTTKNGKIVNPMLQKNSEGSS